MAERKTPKHIKIEGPELSALKALCEDLQNRMTSADSDIAYQAYRNAWRVVSKYYTRGQVEYQQVIDADTRKAIREKRTSRKER
ncbi:MAG TPA: hypothetical protein VKV37_11170 [Ktedonobacteraceae bacterium]|jgi:hypothetical protein|nr:hypothetical protein [Ktedonobacteraceae bacterium]